MRILFVLSPLAPALCAVLARDGARPVEWAPNDRWKTVLDAFEQERGESDSLDGGRPGFPARVAGGADAPPLETAAAPDGDFQFHCEITRAPEGSATVVVFGAVPIPGLGDVAPRAWHSVDFAVRRGNVTDEKHQTDKKEPEKKHLSARVARVVVDGRVVADAAIEFDPAPGAAAVRVAALGGTVGVRAGVIAPLGERYTSPRLLCEAFDDSRMIPMFNGVSLKGWHVSAASNHSTASRHHFGGRWRVERGAIAGSQDKPGNGGLLLTDRHDISNCELVVEMKNDFGPDSGLFLRSTEDGVAYQAHVDYYKNGTLMGLYGEAMARGFRFSAFHFMQSPDQIEDEGGAFPLPFPASRWGELWDSARWNELRVRIEGQPPRITTWINGARIVDWRDPEMRHAERGAIGLQVHGGGDFTRQSVRYRNLRMREL